MAFRTVTLSSYSRSCGRAQLSERHTMKSTSRMTVGKRLNVAVEELSQRNSILRHAYDE